MNSDIIEVDHFSAVLAAARLVVFSQKQSINFEDHHLLTWPLFLSCEQQQDSIDVCATALGVMALSVKPRSGNIAEEESKAIWEGVSTLLFLRNENGSWPSQFSLISDSVTMQGIVGDTYYALSALLEVGFLSPNPQICTDVQTLPPWISDGEKRLEYLVPSIQWLLNSRINRGWYYTGLEGCEHSRECIMPTANVMMVLTNAYEKLGSFVCGSQLRLEIAKALFDSVQLICDTQNRDGGFGSELGAHSTSSNTARAIIALCNVRQALGNVITNLILKQLDATTNRAYNWLMRCFRPGIEPTADVFETFYQAVFHIGHGVYNRQINHESFAEALVADCLRCYYETYMQEGGVLNSKQKLVKKMLQCAKEISVLQVSTGPMAGNIQCRRQGNLDKYPIYTVSDTIRAYSLIIDNTELYGMTKRRPLVIGATVSAYLALLCIVVISAVYVNRGLIAIIVAIVNPIALNLVSSMLDRVILGLHGRQSSGL